MDAHKDYQTKEGRMGKEDKWAVFAFIILAGLLSVMIAGIFGTIIG